MLEYTEIHVGSRSGVCKVIDEYAHDRWVVSPWQVIDLNASGGNFPCVIIIMERERDASDGTD